MFYNSLREKFVPTEILNSDYKVQKAFLDGFYVGDGNKSVHRTGNYFDIAGKTSVAGMFQLIQNIGNITAINAYTKKLNVYMLTINEKMKYGREPNTVKKILDVTDKYKDTYVYDLETEDHTFHAGIGNMIVHNSAYSSLKEDEFKEYDEQFKQNKIDKSKKTSLEKYGCEHHAQCENSKNKAILTNLKKYGVKYATQIPSMKIKSSETTLKKYGVDHPLKCPEIRNKIKEITQKEDCDDIKFPLL